MALRKSIERLLPEALPLLASTLGERRPDLLAAHPDFGARALKLNRAIEQAFHALPDLPAPLSQDRIDAWVERLIECDADCDGRCCALASLLGDHVGAEAS